MPNKTFKWCNRCGKIAEFERITDPTFGVLGDVINDGIQLFLVPAVEGCLECEPLALERQDGFVTSNERDMWLKANVLALAREHRTLCEELEEDKGLMFLAELLGRAGIGLTDAELREFM